MNQRIHNLSKWRFLEEGHAMHYPGRAQRTVIVDVNCPDEVCFYIRQDAEDVLADPEIQTDEAFGRRGGREAAAAAAEAGGSLVFIAVCKGRDRLEFAVDGPFDLVVEGGSAYVFSTDGQDIATRIVAPEIYTRIANRRQRNPHLEMIQYQMRLNQERFQRQLEDESKRRIEALEKRLETYAPQRDIRAPAERVGGEERRDGLSEGNVDADAVDPPAPPDDGGPGGGVPRKRKKAEAAEDL